MMQRGRSNYYEQQRLVRLDVSPYRSLLQYYCLYSDGNIRQNYGLNCLVLRRVDVGYTVV